MRSALLWMLILFVSLFHVLTIAYSPLPRAAEVVFASQIYGHADLTHCLAVSQPNFRFSPIYFEVTHLFTDHAVPSIFRYRIAGLLTGLLCLPLIYLMARWAGMRKLYADILLILLCFEPGYALLLHNGQADTTALLLVVSSAVILTRRTTPAYGHYIGSGLLMGLATLTILPLFWLTLMVGAWLAYIAYRRQGWQSWLGILLYLVPAIGLPIGYALIENASVADWWGALNAWQIPIVNYTTPSATAHQWWYIYPFHYAVLGAGIIIGLIWAFRSGIQLSAAPALSLVLTISYFVFVQPRTGNSAFALPLIYFILLYMADHIGQKLGWYVARPWVLIVVGNNLVFSAIAIFLVMSSLGGRDYAMADYELRKIKPNETVAADARYYFSIIKNGGEFVLISANLTEVSKSLPRCLTATKRPDYVLLHETSLNKKQIFWPVLALSFDTVPVAKLRSYIPMNNLSHDQYGWLAIRNQAWQMNYDGALYRALPNK